MRWQFTIIYPDATTEIIDEPVGWDAIEWSAKRNMKHHGIFFNISTDSFEFVGDAFTILTNEYNTYGANADLTFLVEYDCDYSGTWSEYFRGKFDFNTYQRECGDYCCVKIAISSSSCVDVFLSRNDQDVNLATTVDLDGNAVNPLTDYAVRFNGQNIYSQDKADNDAGDVGVSSTSDTTGSTGNRRYYLPIYLPNISIADFDDFADNNIVQQIYKKNDGIDTIDNDNMVNYLLYGQFLKIFSPNINIQWNIPTLTLSWKLKGSFKITTNYTGAVKLSLAAYKKNWGADSDTDDYGSNVVSGYVALVANVQTVIPFDDIFSNTTLMPSSPTSAIYFYWFIEIAKATASALDTVGIAVDYDAGTNMNYFWLEGDSIASPVNVDCYNLQDVMMFLPHTYTGQDCVEVIQNVSKLNYFHITNGLKIRRVTNPSTPNIFTNWQFMFNNIQKIFNIGWGFDKNDTQLVIGNLDFFYNAGQTAINVGAVDKVTFTHAKDLTYSGATIGYSKWEGEEINGLDAVNTKREYSRNIDSNNNKLTLMSDIIADGYTIEITRRRSQDNNGTEDWRFDNDIFIVNITYSEEYQQIMTYNGIDSGAANIYSPSTRYNYKITPARMMMEWMKSFVAANPNYPLDDLQFRSGTGNYIAQGLMSTQYSLETHAISESQTLTNDDFDQQIFVAPLWNTIYAEFEAPFSMNDYEQVKLSPYGVVTFSCAGVVYDSYLIECNHRPNDGIASLKVLLKNTYEQ